METAAEIIQKYEDELDRIFSVYLDADHGFTEVSKLATSIYHPTYEPADRRTPEGETAPGHFIYAPGKPEDSNYTELSARSPKQIIADNCSDGYNRTFMAHVCIVIAYQLWDEEYRPRLADAWGIQPGEIRVPIFGELRFIRRSVIHYCGRAIEDHSNSPYFTPVRKGEPLTIHRDDMNGIWFHLKQCLKKLAQDSPHASQDA